DQGAENPDPRQHIVRRVPRRAARCHARFTREAVPHAHRDPGRSAPPSRRLQDGIALELPRPGRRSGVDDALSCMLLLEKRGREWWIRNAPRFFWMILLPSRTRWELNPALVRTNE